MIIKIIDNRGKAKYAKIGSTAVSSGLKEKINRTTNSTVIDDMLLSSEVGTLKPNKQNDGQLFNYVVTDELSNGVDDQFLLGKPILSNLNNEEDNFQNNPIEKYRGNQRNKKNEGRRMWNNDYRPERQDINSQNFDKYQNYFHQDNNQNFENENRMDTLGKIIDQDIYMVQ